MKDFRRVVVSLLAFVLLAAASHAQEVEPPKGTVLIQSHGEAPSAADEKQPTQTEDTGQKVDLSDAQRSALTFTSYDLDARLTPATAALAMRARVTLRNDGSEPLTHIAMQLSSTLKWESATLVDGAKRTPLVLSQHLLDTDADHTGRAREVILLLPGPLASGASVTLDTFYSGTLPQSAGRLDRIGASSSQATAADWDAIATGNIALRGFGDVLWYPVAAPQLFLGDGAKLFQAIGRARLREQAESMKLRVALAYTSDPPAAVYFCGRRQPLVAVSDDVDAPVAMGSGIATAEFAAQPLGFRTPSLFVVERPESLIASSLLAVETPDEKSLPLLAASAERIAPLLQKWFGARPLTALTIIDHAGQPFEDGPLVVGPVASLGSSDASVALAHSLAHSWIQTGEPWMDEGLSQFAALLWVEQEQGRDSALRQLDELVQPLALAEPAVVSGQLAKDGQPLVEAADDLYYRRKAAAVWWMLRGITANASGDGPLHDALSAWCAQPLAHAGARDQALAFEKLLEKTSGKDLAWFFRDWVLQDVGLPDLTIVDVTPRFLPIGQGHSSGWLVAVTVRNDGAAEVEVPVTIRSGSFSTTRRLRIPGGGNATDREIVADAPNEVVVNDGSTPEVRASLHTRTVTVRTQ